MDLPINPNTPIQNVTPTGPGPGGFTPLQKLLIDTFSPSISAILPTPPLDASNPRISAAEFFAKVSDAQRKQMIQDYINKITDPTLRQALLEEVVKRAGSIANIITLIVQYRELIFRLDQLDLKGKQKHLNDEIDNFNTSSGQDQTEVNDMNAAISTFTTAQTTYQGALTTYDGALTTFTSAQASYNSALTTWNTALNAYNSGSITAIQLQAAKATFDLAKGQFATAQTTLGTATTTFNNAKTAWLNAQTALTTEKNSYNAYVDSRDSGLNSAKHDYNAAVQQALPILSQMNDIQSGLFGTSSLETPTSYSGGTGLNPFDEGIPGPDTLRNQVEGNLDISNGTATSMNTLIGQISSIITTINNGGYTPPLIAPSPLIPIPTLPTANSNFVLTPVQINAPSHDSFDFAALTKFDTSFLQIMLSAVNEYNTTTDKNDDFQKQLTDLITPFASANLPDQSVGVGSSVSVTANSSIAGRSNPHLQGALSKHVFETAMNVFGVPAGSPLVDQLGALLFGYQTALGFTSAGPAHAIIGDNPINGSQGIAGVSAAVALGNLLHVQDLVSGDQITANITKIVNADPTLKALTPEAKTALIQSLVLEIGATLIKSALNQLASSIDLPGLVSQILANLSNLLAPESTSTDLSQVVSQLILAQELAKQLNISKTTAETIVQNAIAALALKNEAATQDAITREIVNQIRADQAINAEVRAGATQQSAVAEDAQQEQISEDAALEASVHQGVVAADNAHSARVQAETNRVNNAKRDTFLNALADDLNARQVDPAKIKRLLDIYRPTVLNALISGLIKPNYLEALTNHLIKLGLTPEEAGKVAQTAISKANAKDATLNPLNSFIGGQVVGIGALSGLFKSQVANILAPVVGQREALAVAEDYGNKIFLNPNSAIRLLENNERNVAKLSGYNFNARVFEDYRNAYQISTNPQAAQGTPLHEGNVLLLSGAAAGLGTKGTTSVDNKLGVFANYTNSNPI